jgi:hypothetical protein
MAEIVNAETKQKSLFLSTIESYYLFEHLRGWSHDNYLEFYPEGKLKQVYSTGKRTEDRAKQLGLSYDGMVHFDPKMSSELYSVISKNRAAGAGTELTIELDGKGEVKKVTPKTVRSFDF